MLRKIAPSGVLFLLAAVLYVGYRFAFDAEHLMLAKHFLLFSTLAALGAVLHPLHRFIR